MDLKQCYIHRKENGNILFTYEEITISKRKWWIIIPLVLELFLCLSEYISNNSCYSLILAPFCILFLIYVFYRLVRSNENMEQRIVEELLKDNITNYIKQQGDDTVDLGHQYRIATEDNTPNRLEITLSTGKIVYYDTYFIRSINNKIITEINITPHLEDITKSN